MRTNSPKALFGIHTLTYQEDSYVNRVIVMLVSVLLVTMTACSGKNGGGGTTSQVGVGFPVGGTVSGLSGAGLVLQNNGGDDLAVSANGSFTFGTAMADGSSYAVTVATQPTGQTCTVNNGTGTISGASVTNVSVVCAVTSYSVGGTVSGLTGSGLVLRNNGADDLSISSSGSFTFTTNVADNAGYTVTVKTQPGGQTCVVSNGTGTISGANITNVSLSCTDNPYTVGGAVSGLTGSGLVLQNNGRDDLSVTAGNFTFTWRLADGDSYAVTVKTQPTGQLCAVSNGISTIQGAHVTDVAVQCGVNLGSVSPFYPTNGADWNDYVKNNGGTVYSADDTACAGTETGGYSACLHGGEMRVATVTGKSSCTALTASDALGAFDWTCDASTGAARFISTGLKNEKNLSDLIDFTAPGWGANSVIVYDGGTVYGTTMSSVWWQNPVTIDNDGGPLDAAGTIYVVTNDALAQGYTINASSVGLMGKPGVIINGPGGGSYSRVIKADGSADGAKDFLWIEGSVDGAGDATGIYLNTVRFSVLRNVEANKAGNGVYLLFSDNNKLSRIAASNNTDTGVWLDASRSNSLSDITTSNSTDGIQLRSTPPAGNPYAMPTVHPHGNKLSGITAIGNIRGLYLRVSNNNILTDITASDNRYGISFEDADRNCLIGITASNNTVYGLHAVYGSYNTLSQLATLNSGTGVYFDESWYNTFSDVAVSDNEHVGIKLDTSGGNKFTGFLRVGNNGAGNCSVTGATNPSAGLFSGCGNNGSSDAVLLTGVTLGSSFKGKETSDDAVNANDTNGSASFSSITDWTGFENRYRGWGNDGSAFPNADNRGPCETGTCRIWDWSLTSSDTVIQDVLSFPTGSAYLTHVWYVSPAPSQQSDCDNAVPGSAFVTDHCESAFLRRAVEIEGDGIGNDNTLCESNETCLSTLNIGAYQGHGNLVDAGAITDGAITGVTLKRYQTNGY